MYLLHLKVLLNPAFNCCYKLSPSSVDKVTTCTRNFVSIILTVSFVGALIPATAGSTSGPVSLYALLVITQFTYQVKDTSQLITIQIIMFSKNCLSVLMVQQV